MLRAAAKAGKPWSPSGWKAKVGDDVMAVWAVSTYYSGKVKSISADKVKVAWADGSEPSDAPMATTAAEPTASTPLPAQGDYVLVKSGSSWSYGQVTSVADGQCEIKTSSGNVSAKAGKCVKLGQ